MAEVEAAKQAKAAEAKKTDGDAAIAPISKGDTKSTPKKRRAD